MSNSFEGKKAFLFDFDGTLVDSMGMWAELDKKLMRKHGIEPPPDLTEQLIPLSEEESAKLFLTLGCQGSVESILREIDEMANEAYVKDILLKPYAKEFLTQCKATGAKVALLTASTFNRIFPCLERNGMMGWFDLILSCGEYGYSKTQPEFYSFALSSLKVDAKDAAFFDDNLMAVMTAKASGILSVGVYDVVSDENWGKMRMEADMTVGSFKELLDETKGGSDPE